MKSDLESLAELFLSNGLTVAFAESCTGGLLAAAVTALPGCSAWFRGGVVAYHNYVKEHLLGVSAETLQQHGAVSPQTAVEMAVGVRGRCGADMGLSVTGIAGPDGGSADKPVGTVYLALVDADGCQVVQCSFSGNRDEVRGQTVRYGLLMLKNRLE